MTPHPPNNPRIEEQMDSEMIEIEPLTDEEGEAAFIALVAMLDARGCAPAAAVSEKDDGGISFSLHFNADRARKLTAYESARTPDPAIVKLREALEPFAENIKQQIPDDFPITLTNITVGDVRRAYSALSPSRQDKRL
jgi:hypothetical protein